MAEQTTTSTSSVLSSLNPASLIGGAGMNVLGGLFRGIFGARQKKKGEQELESLKRPIYERPQEINEMDRITALRAMQGLPMENVLLDRVGQNTAQTIVNAKDFGGSDAVYKAQINANNALANIGIESAQQRLQNELQRVQTLNVLADYADKEFDYNLNIPFQEKRKSALDKIGAGTQNINNALNQLTNVASGFMGSDFKNVTPKENAVGYDEMMQEKEKKQQQQNMTIPQSSTVKRFEATPFGGYTYRKYLSGNLF